MARRRVTGALVLLGLPAAGVAALWAAQEELIYFPRRYPAELLAHPPSGLAVLRDPQEPQAVLGFYRAPDNGNALERLWLVFGGNGDLALNWDAVVRPSATQGRGFLLVEYPGYGARPGKPSPEYIRRATLESLSALAASLGTTTAELAPRIAVLGYSLGTAAALDYAARHPVQRIVLIAPFTTMLEMARLSVGAPLSRLLRHRYDNVESLRAIERHGMPPLTILHGDRDRLIPQRMGRALADVVAGARFVSVAGADHRSVVIEGEAELRALLAL